ncbi:MAG: efflux RND transporter periplasmic adaptor subunit [Ignavibacteriae bacterium]|nr:efflux RND transporter periplasmic adaptor subunit [Ignavibacteriota bacterium]
MNTITLKTSTLIRVALAALGVISIFMFYTFIFAHEGEDHGAVATQTTGRGDTIAMTKQAQFLLGVLTDVAKKRTINPRLNLLGKIVAPTLGKAEVFPPISGRVVADGYRIPTIGTRVTQGQILAVLQQALASPEQSQLVTERFKADAEFNQASKDLERLKQLEGVVAQKEVQQAEIRFESAKKQKEFYDKALAGNYKEGSNRFYVKSPITGVVADAEIAIGEQVEVNKRLFTIVNSSTLWVEGQIYEIDLGKIERTKDAYVSTQTYPDDLFRAKLFSMGSTIDEATRTVKAIYQVNNPQSKLKVGMLAEVGVSIGTPFEALAIPADAVVDVRGKSIVFIHVAPEQFVARDVVVGTKDGSYVQVKSGVNDGDRVVTVGNYQLKSSIQ